MLVCAGVGGVFSVGVSCVRVTYVGEYIYVSVYSAVSGGLYVCFHFMRMGVAVSRVINQTRSSGTIAAAPKNTFGDRLAVYSVEGGGATSH